MPFPPPLIFVGFFALGLLLERAAPLSMPPRPVTLPAGVAMTAVGLLLNVWTLLLFAAERTTVLPFRESAAFIVGGSYRFSRNRMYLAMALLHAGVALWFDVVWALLFLPIAILAVRHFVIAREERYLAVRFGDAYAEYRAHVRRWI